MKKILLILSILSFVSFSDTAKIASFNTLRLGKNNKDYKLMANVISQFELVGLVEVMNKNGLENLVRALEKKTGEKWGYHISPYSVGNSEYKEYYGYVWKKDKVKFIKESGFYPGENEYSREPYGAGFKIGSFDFTLILVHIIFGKEESRRRGEIFKLNKVYDYFQNQDLDENDIIIAGDFNFIAFDESFENLLNHKDKIIYALDPVIKTTLGANKLSSSYDNIFLSLIHTDEFTGKSGAVDFTDEKYKEMKEKISDHLPIFIEVDILEDDD
ncbi:MAG: endonuclease/exonuclease/phosphatase family protein [Fusobacteriaceae bacterium]|nr:endonuclease/exonuclease/phosphatase family protein [Fusobacteriaceae bacterium]